MTEGLLSPGALTGCTTIIDAWETPPGEIQWLDPETLETLKEQPPHVQITLSHRTTVLAGETSPICETQSDYILPRDTLTAIVTAIHNRVYQAGFEKQTIFPVSEEQLRSHFNEIHIVLICRFYYSLNITLTACVSLKQSSTSLLRSLPLEPLLHIRLAIRKQRHGTSSCVCMQVHLEYLHPLASTRSRLFLHFVLLCFVAI